MSHPSITVLDELLRSLAVGPARRRQLGMVRQELTVALEQHLLPGGARRDLPQLLDEAVLRHYVQVAKTGALRSRLVNGEKPPTSGPTNAARLACLTIIRRSAGLPVIALETAGPVTLKSVPESERLGALRRRLRHDLSRVRSPAHARFIAVLAVALDTRARVGELVAQRIDHLSGNGRSIDILRRPQHGTDTPPLRETLPLSPLSRDALDRWLPIRTELTETLEGSATALWVSLAHNHAGTLHDDGSYTRRRQGMPLQQRGLIRSYNSGRHRYELTHLLPPKLEQLRRALESEVDID
ncbi:hypothetical protein EKH77_27100 [Streptomyces luteoverticillatus]|uniref:Site-specific integrase n=1 Tax=Streptomyces luteoverticillatus TaxID=66425 RepID=A0A3S9PQ13_STRLT|nr:hypothetical protein [Streptomyces luteoverticillatus]AZQ74388.1 hypothetical protein EKH77_27100 [Streptomyces luteoverticillatus]